MRHIGAISILTTILLSLAGWAGITLVGAVENIAVLKAKDISRKELILRVDNKIDKQSIEIKALDDKLDQIIIKLK